MRPALVALAGLLVSSTALAQQTTSNAYLLSAIRLYADMEYPSALEQLDKAKEQKGLSQSDDVTLHVYRGLVKAEMADMQAAEEDFKYALGIEPGMELKVKVSPKVRDVFEKARAEIRKYQPKDVVVTKPPDAPVRQHLVEGREVPIQVTPPPTTTTTVEKKTSPVPFILLGVGVALAGGGVVFGLQSSGSVDDARKAQFQLDANDRLNSARSQALVANVLYGAAAVAVIAGAVTLFTSSSSPAAPAEEAR